MLQLIKISMTSRGILLLLAILLLHGSRCWAEEPQQPAATAATEAQSVSSPIAELTDEQQAAGFPAPISVKGLRVYRDPKTGQLGAPPPGIQPPGLSAAEQQMLNRSDRGLQAHTLPNGAVAVDLQGRFRSMAVATVHDGNKPAVQCEVTPHEAETALQTGALNRTGHGEH
jgi:hypothetical protein